MIPVIRHIQFLISRHDCVIIPGWGALIAHRLPARIDHSSSVIFPPSRIVVFNPAISHDDAMIASSIARQENCGYEAASLAVAEFSEALRRQIEAEGSVSVPRIGSFRLTPDHTILFEPDSDGIANAGYFGLPQVSLAPLQSHASNVSAASFIPESPAVIRTPWSHRVLRVAASVAVLVGLGLTLSTPISPYIDNGIDFASIGISRSAKTEAAKQEFTPLPDREDALLMIFRPDPASAEAPIAVQKPAVRTDDLKRPVEGHGYYLIVASLETRQKADRYLKRHEGEGLALIEGQGRFRIYAASGTSIKDASRLMDDSDFRRKHPDAWVYRARK